ncbi:hypothetical protein ScPMuIL_007294, partial [Solemya velum]
MGVWRITYLNLVLSIDTCQPKEPGGGQALKKNYKLQAEKTPQQQIRCLLDTLPRRGENAFPSFIEALKETGNEHIVKKLEQQGEGASCSPTNDVTQCRPVVQNVTGDGNIVGGPGSTFNVTGATQVVSGENKTCILI